MHLSRNGLTYLALGLGVITLSFSGIFVHWSTAPGSVTAFYRMLIAAMLLFPVVLWRVRTVGWPSKAVWIFPLLGGLFTALDQGLWSTSLSFTSIANATLLNNIAPLWVALYAALFWHERNTRRFWIGLLLTLMGAAVVLGNDILLHPHLTLWDAIALGSSFAWAGYYLVTQRGRFLIDTLVYIWLVEVTTAALLGLTCVTLRLPLTGYPTTTWLSILAVALVSQVTGHFLLAYALGHVPASIVAPTMILLPVMTSLLAIPFAGQALSAGQWFGGVAVLAGIYIVNISRASQKTDAKPVIPFHSDTQPVE